jgi:hypothetical protein
MVLFQTVLSALDMEINKKFFPGIMKENEAIYFASLQGVIESVDELASLEITKTPKEYKFRLVPSLPKYTNMLIEELLKFHNLIGVRLDMSKSIKTSATITFNITLN